MLPASALDDHWLDDVAGLQPGPFLFLAEGVFMYLTAVEVRNLVVKLSEKFPGSLLYFDACSPARPNAAGGIRWSNIRRPSSSGD